MAEPNMTSQVQEPSRIVPVSLLQELVNLLETAIHPQASYQRVATTLQMLVATEPYAPAGVERAAVPSSHQEAG